MRDGGVALAALVVVVAALLLAFGPRIADTRDRLARVQLERHGLAEAAALHAILELEIPLSAPRTGRPDAIEKALHRLSALDERQPLLASGIDAILVAWAARDPADPALEASVSSALRDVVHRSRLDSDEDGAIAAIASQVLGRLTTDAITTGRAGAHAAEYAKHPTLPRRLFLAGAAERVHMIADATDEYLRFATDSSPDLAQTLSSPSARARTASSHLVDDIGEMLVASAPQNCLGRVRARVLELEDAIDATVDTALPLIDGKLAPRERELQRTQTFLWVVTFAFLLLSSFVVPAILRAWRVRRDLRLAKAETGRLQALVARARAEARFGAVFERAALGIAVFRRDGTLQESNPALDAMLGVPPRGMIGRKVGDFTHPDDRARTFASMERLLRGETSSYQIEKRYLRADGTSIWADVSVSLLPGDDGEETLVISLVDDVSERVAMRERLIYEATHDSLTGLANRPLFLQRVSRMLDRADSNAIVAFVDLDHFKDVNDSLGHAAGDALLCKMADRLFAAARAEDGEVVARLGGDEFALLLVVEPGPEALAARAAALLDCIAAPVEVDGHVLYTTASIGLAPLGERYSDAADPLRDADIALYRAKHRGRARSEIFDSAMHDGALRHLQMTGDLRAALSRDGELTVAFQPIVCLDGEAVVAHEALVRWNHPRDGWLAPDEFIPLAEQTGLIVALGAYVLRTSVAWLAAQRTARPEATIHVNISVRELVSSDIVTLVEETLGAYGVPAHALALEITEGAVVDPGSQSVAVLERLRALGLRVCVDDFGTGYSSLRYLRSLPITDLKIDRSFIIGADDELAAPAIVRMLLELATSLDLTVVAEGIESAEQAATLAALGCRFAQGYYFGRPAVPELAAV